MNITNKIMNEATEWVFLLDQADDSNFPVSRWSTWMQKSQRHEEAFQKALKLWGVAGSLPDIGACEFTAEAASMNGKDLLVQTEGRQWINACFVRKAIAASFAMMVITAIFYSYSSVFSVTYQSESHFSSNFKTSKKQLRLLELPDGTTVELGAFSEIKVDFTEHQRNITLLHGEGFFNVAEDLQRPFNVFSNGTLAQAIGTAFYVHRDLQNTTVSVVEGIVQISATSGAEEQSLRADDPTAYKSGKSSRLIAGELASVSVSGEISSVTNFDIEEQTSWRKGRLVFVDKNIRAVSADLSRYSDLDILVDAGVPADLRFTGTVLEDGVSDWLEVLPKVLDVKILNQGDHILIESN